MRQFRFHVRSLILMIALVAVVLALRDRLHRRWYSCVGLANHHTQQAWAYEARSRDAASRRANELADRSMRVAWWHHRAASRYQEAAFKFYLPRPNLPRDGPPIDEQIDLEAEYISHESLHGPDPAAGGPGR